MTIVVAFGNSQFISLNPAGLGLEANKLEDFRFAIPCRTKLYIELLLSLSAMDRSLAVTQIMVSALLEKALACMTIHETMKAPYIPRQNLVLDAIFCK